MKPEKRWIVVHTYAAADTPLKEERESLDAPEIDLRLSGPCKTPEAVLEAVRDADAAICFHEPYTRAVFEGSPNLKLVMRYGVGVDTIDLAAATEHNVVVGYLPDFCIREVANHALAMLLALAKKLPQLDSTLRRTGWKDAWDHLPPMGAIHGETLGLLAFGNIARQLARLVKPLEMRVVAHDPYTPQEVFAREGVESLSLEQVAAQSDYISCHLPLTDATRQFIGADFFTRMKPTAYFINTSRGKVIDELALINALQQKSIAGAALDVFEHEPLEPTHPLCQLDNVILTPHTASYSDETKATQKRRVGRNVLMVVRGSLPEFVANPQVLEKRAK